MKTFILSLLFACFSFASFAQTKSETIKVAGECGMCKKKIETAAKGAGATSAAWDSDSKILTVKYAANKTNTAKIEQAVAAVGYDTPNYKATEEAYSKLDECCKYERAAASEKMDCCKGENKEKCMQDGKCKPDMSCCKEEGKGMKACCKNEGQAKHDHQ